MDKDGVATHVGGGETVGGSCFGQAGTRCGQLQRPTCAHGGIRLVGQVDWDYCCGLSPSNSKVFSLIFQSFFNIQTDQNL
jgi:hypothetical protein